MAVTEAVSLSFLPHTSFFFKYTKKVDLSSVLLVMIIQMANHVLFYNLPGEVIQQLSILLFFTRINNFYMNKNRKIIYFTAVNQKVTILATETF